MIWFKLVRELVKIYVGSTENTITKYFPSETSTLKRYNRNLYE